MGKKSIQAPPPRYRDADIGEYVTKKYADTHTKTTVKETNQPM